MDVVYISNPSKRGDANHRDLVLNYQGEEIVIPPGEKKLVLLEVATAFFGHPGERDSSRSKDRSGTYDRLRFKWGYQLGQVGADEQWEVSYPPFRVTTMEGEYLPMVLDDPLGKFPQPGTPAVAEPVNSTDVALLRAAVAESQAQIEKLTVMLAASIAASNPGVVPAAVAKDGDNENDGIPAATDEGVTSDKPRSTRIGNKG